MSANNCNSLRYGFVPPERQHSNTDVPYCPKTRTRWISCGFAMVVVELATESQPTLCWATFWKMIESWSNNFVIQCRMISLGVILRRVSGVTMLANCKRPFLPIALPLPTASMAVRRESPLRIHRASRSSDKVMVESVPPVKAPVLSIASYSGMSFRLAHFD